MKSKSTAVLLAIFLGGIGAHKFYLERPGFGVLYLMFCWTFIPAVLGILDALEMLCTSPEKWQRLYGKL